MSTLAETLAMLMKHTDVIQLVIDALEGGADKDAVTSAIQAAMVQTSDEAMREELGQT